MVENECGKLLVVSLWAKDLVTTAHFYRDVIGFPLMPHHGAHVTFDIGDGVHLVILQGDSGPDRSVGEARWPVLAFRVADLDECVKRLSEHGVELPWGIESGPGSRYVMLADPGGNLIELAQLE